MNWLRKIIGCFLLVIFWLSAEISAGEICFPDKFIFGVSTAAYQIEGAWNVSDKGESIWDRYTHEHPERIFDHKNADIAADSYHHIDEDIQMLKELGVDFYRFSLSWPRILPTGFSNKISKDGVRYYNELIDKLIANKIKPLVTIYHFDLPQSLQDLGGWTNPLMVDYYVDYARVVFETFGDRVKNWITFNEPETVCLDGYGGSDAPGDYSSGIETYYCGHNLLKAHGLTYKMFQEEYYNKFKGSITISLSFSWFENKTQSKEDQEAAEIARAFMLGWFAHPILSRTGDYPPLMRKRIDDMSKKQGYPRSRLPTFTKEEVEYIVGSIDYLGLNSYTTTLVSQGNGTVNKKPDFFNDMGVKLTKDPTWPKSNSTWLRVVPWGFRKMLNWVKDTYDNPIILITENGVSTMAGLQDIDRIAYLHGYLKALHHAVMVDKCDVRGYTYWSLMDNFEWTRGFSERFGLYEVDYESPERRRTPRASVAFYKHLATTGCIPSTTHHFHISKF